MDDDDMFIGMLANGTKRKSFSPSKKDDNLENLQKLYKKFETLVKDNEVVLNNFSDFLRYMQVRLETSVMDFEKYLYGKKE